MCHANLIVPCSGAAAVLKPFRTPCHFYENDISYLL